MDPRPSRPSLPPGLGIERATGPPGERLPWPRVRGWLTAGRNYWVCTVRPDGRPHTKPVWGLWLDGAFVFSTHPSSVTAGNLRRNLRVSVHLENDDGVVVVEGTARRSRDRKLLGRYGRTYEAKYRWPMTPWDVDPDNPDAAFFAVRPRTALSWESGGEVGETITRWTFSEGA